MQKIYSSEQNFLQKLQDILSNRSRTTDLYHKVREIIEYVKKERDSALIALCQKYDNFTPKDNLAISSSEINSAYDKTDKAIIKALENAANRIKDYHQRQIPENYQYHDAFGNLLGWRYSAIERVALYVPGGKASYPSSVLMNAIPAIAAGCPSIAMTVPTPNGEYNPAILAAAKICGIEEIYPIGGAQAIAAFAYGTPSIKDAYKIVGPGNAYVAEAKRQLFGHIGIDSIAGPSEICVVADGGNVPAHVAIDLLSQAEHDEEAQSILITDDEKFADMVIAEVEKILPTLSRHRIAAKSWQDNGVVIICDKSEYTNIINIIAPEHLELMISDAAELLPNISNAGAIFMGSHTPEAMGDYLLGPSHVLPTMQSSRFSSGLSVYDFLKRSSIMKCSKEGFAALADDAKILADCEGLTAHGLSVSIVFRQ